MFKFFNELKNNFNNFKTLSKLLAVISFITFAFEISSIFFDNLSSLKDLIFLSFLTIIIMVLVKRYTELKININDISSKLDKTQNEYKKQLNIQLSLSDNIMESIHNFLHSRRFYVFKIFKIQNEFEIEKAALIENILNELLKKSDDEDFAVSSVYSIIKTPNNELNNEIEILKTEFPNKNKEIEYILKKKNELYNNFKPKIEEITKKYLFSLMAHLVRSLENRLKMKNLDEKISASIQMLDKPTTRKNLNKSVADSLEYFTYFRDAETYSLNKRNLLERFKISSNTLFEKSFWGKERKEWFQYSNNMKQEHAQGKIKIQRENFWEYYNASANVPIQFHNKNFEKYPNIYGFLSVDCKNTNNKNIFSFNEDFHILAAYADALASYFKTLDELFPDLYINN